MRNIFAVQAEMRSQSQSVGALVVTADDITQALTQWDGVAASVDQAVDACTTLDPATRAEWQTFYASYRAFSEANKNHFFFALGLPEISDQVIVFEKQIAAWNDAIKAQCRNDVVPTPTSQDVIAQNDSPIPGGAKAATDTLASFTKLVAVVGVVLLAAEVLPTILRKA